ncbi:hypothetical protein LTR70_002841 [Exophiala xenobiotica]|uniref:Diphthine--ammonia ligase n=1 Tax=Lithohypha guttulata TaxID=1690604 RepID=A0ABR0KIZ8_9EURO|nr:hypothetical protein LTR24_002055 [Lithohypha guttulata]KAK5324557.1 hypothetical protein LTR70_002841 [Exophiala xenobiotica]
MSLNVIGLVSGGKDSLFSLAHCVKNGHNVVALANLYPRVEGGDDDDGEGSDLNSFMYQTVGHTIVPLYAKALGVPLYRRAIRGTARQTGRYYDTSNTSTEPDETEDMYLLIQDVLRHQPEANALNAGAILSTYQRTRVESVAIRLGLTPLAYLWQYPALPPPSSRIDSLTGLLDDMDAAHCDARIIKIASGGIRNKLLFANVAAPATGARLVSGLARFFTDEGQEFALRGAVIGEGGEYETLALDGPGPLWKKRIEVDFTGSFEAEGGATYATFGRAGIVDKTDSGHVDVLLPNLLDKRFTAVQIFNLTFPKSGLSPSQQLEHTIDMIPPMLNDLCHILNLDRDSLTLQHIASTTLLLRSIDNFGLLNQIYAAKMWPKGLPNPPSRVTIAAPLPQDTHVSLSVVLDLDGSASERRKGLHVQSLSYWAPANIGPYSQAISTPVLLPQNTASHSLNQSTRAGSRTPIEIVHMAGQIPLVPASMALLARPFSEQAVLALQHLWRVGQERSVDLWAGAGVAYLAHPDNNAASDRDARMLNRVREAARIWGVAHQVNEKGIEADGGTEAGAAGTDEEDEDIDLWDLQQRNRGFGAAAVATLTVGEHLHVLPSRMVFESAGPGGPPSAVSVSASNKLVIPIFIAAEVAGLPRNAPVEWWSTGIAGLATHAGKQQCRVWRISRNIGKVASLSGIAIEHIGHHEAGDEDENDDAGAGLPPQQNSISFFFTLLTRPQLDGSLPVDLPRTPNDLRPTLFEDDRASMTCETVTAQSFLNLSCPPDARASLEKVPLIQQATLVPCSHVWASNAKTTDDGEATATGDPNEDAPEEVAAAIILRIDAYS